MLTFIYRLLILLGFSIDGDEPVLVAEASLGVIAYTTWPAGAVYLYETPYTKRRSVKFDNTQTIEQYAGMPLFDYGIRRWLNGDIDNQYMVSKIQNHHDMLMRRLFLDVPKEPIVPVTDKEVLFASIPITFTIAGDPDRDTHILINLFETTLTKARRFSAEGLDWVIDDRHHLSHEVFLGYISPWLHGSDETVEHLMRIHSNRYKILSGQDVPESTRSKKSSSKTKETAASQPIEFLKPLDPVSKVIPFKNKE